MALDTVTGKIYQVVVVTPTEATPPLTFEIVRLIPNPGTDITDRWDNEGFTALQQDGYFFGSFEGDGPYQKCFYRSPNQYSIIFADHAGKEYVYSVDTNRKPVERIDPPVSMKTLMELRSDTGCQFTEYSTASKLDMIDPWFEFLSTGAWPEKKPTFKELLEEDGYYLYRDL